jgi:hypothetical protein
VENARSAKGRCGENWKEEKGVEDVKRFRKFTKDDRCIGQIFFFSRVDLMLILFNLTVVKVPRRTVVFICFEIGKKLSMRWSVAL